MEIVIFRFIVVWITLHIILFFVEMYRYKHSNWPLYGFFKDNGVLYITLCILFIDIVGLSVAIIMGLGYWILQPILE